MTQHRSGPQLIRLCVDALAIVFYRIETWAAGIALLSALTVGCTVEFDECLIEGRCDSRGRSCTGLAANCGAGESCCAEREVPSGTFNLGTDATNTGSQVPSETPAPEPIEGWRGDDEAAPATISSFSLDLFEVTVGRFRQFVSAYDAWRATGRPAAGAGDHATGGAGWQTSFSLPASRSELEAELSCGASPTWTSTAAGNENLPINCISWYVAFAFCVWDGARLPSEAEWHYAASGGDEQRAFPWSADANISLTDAVVADQPIERVGGRPAGIGRWGHLGLAGNVREWVLDYLDDINDYPRPCNDCVEIAPSNKRIRRGGDFEAEFSRARTTYRSAQPPDMLTPYVGIRCARSN